MIIHVVKPGESIYSISRIYGVPFDKIVKDNELKNPGNLVVGQSLVILEGERKHSVAPGESIYTIAKTYMLTPRAIIKANPDIKNPSKLKVGQIINIPDRTRKYGTLEVNGYAFPEIEMETLKKTLPNLTYLSIFNYEIMKDGSLKGINDIPLIQAAREANVAPLMVITNIEEGKGFSSDIAKEIFTNEATQEKLLNNILQILKSKNYYGLDIDIEYVYPENREDYNRFLKKTVDKLKPLGYSVTTALAPKIAADQPGVLYQGHDYPIHGKLADHVILMTYEWGYTFGPPLAVAPLDQVARVLNYAVTAIPRKKIFMGIPNYGYDWTLPYVKGTAAKALSNVEAVNLAFKEGAFIQYDWKAQAPFFTYYDDMGKEHIVWFEDARSMRAKLELANRYKLGGISYWTIGKYFPQNWLILNSLYDVKKLI